MDVALVHGSYHGAWCWDLLQPELERRSPGDHHGPADLRPDARCGRLRPRRRNALEAKGAPVLVGHSMAGLVIPLVAANRPVRRLIPGGLPPVTRSQRQRPARHRTGRRTRATDDSGVDRRRRRRLDGRADRDEVFFPDATPAIAAGRPSGCALTLSGHDRADTAHGLARRQSRSIVCRDDRAINRRGFGRPHATDWASRLSRSVEAIRRS